MKTSKARHSKLLSILPPSTTDASTSMESSAHTGSEPSPLIHHFIHRHSKRPRLSLKDLSTTQTEPHAALFDIPSTPPIYPKYRASSVYSRPETSWAKPSCWEAPTDSTSEKGVDDGEYFLPSTVYRDETSRALEGFETPLRTYSPVIPEPSPSPSERSHTSPTRQTPALPDDSPEVGSDALKYTSALLPPTPESLRPTTGTFWHEDAELASSPPGSPNHAEAVPAPAAPANGSPSDQSWYEEEDPIAHETSAVQGLGIISLSHPSAESLPRGRTRQRSLPSYYHREQNYIRDSNERPVQAVADGTNLEPSNGALLGVEHGKVSPAPGTGTAKLEAAKMVEQRKVKTLSEAFHKLLVEDYQDLAAEGRAWEAFTASDEVPVIREVSERRQVKLVPEPLIYHSKEGSSESMTSPTVVHDFALSDMEQSTGTGAAKPRAAFPSFRGILPNSKAKRNDSLTCGEIPIHGPDVKTDIPAPLRTSPKPRNKPWSKKETTPAHVPPLPLSLPGSVSKDSSRSLQHSRAKEPHIGISPAAKTVEHSDTHLGRLQPSNDDPTTALPPLPPSSKAFDLLGGYDVSSPTQASEKSGPDGRVSRSLLKRVTSIHSPSQLRDRPFSRLLGTTNGHGGVTSWYGKAKETLKNSEQAKRRHELKKSIRLVGQVDPRSVETNEDTARRLAFAGTGETVST